MRFVKAGLFFLVSFAIAWMVIFTFIQQPFQARVSGKLLWHVTPAYPIYYYLLAALTIGLAIGIGMTIYYYVILSVRIMNRRREQQDLTEQNQQLRSEVERLGKECEELRERSTLRKTERMQALPSPTRPRQKAIGDSVSGPKPSSPGESGDTTSPGKTA